MSEKKHMGMKAKTRLSNTIIYVILTIMSIVWLFPFFCIVCESFRVESTYQVGYVIHQDGLPDLVQEHIHHCTVRCRIPDDHRTVHELHIITSAFQDA